RPVSRSCRGYAPAICWTMLPSCSVVPPPGEPTLASAATRIHAMATPWRASLRRPLQQQQPHVAQEVRDGRSDDGSRAVPEPGEQQGRKEHRPAPGGGRQQVAESKQGRRCQRAADRTPPLLEAHRHVPAVEELLGERDRRVPGDLPGELPIERHAEVEWMVEHARREPPAAAPPRKPPRTNPGPARGGRTANPRRARPAPGARGSGWARTGMPPPR